MVIRSASLFPKASPVPSCPSVPVCPHESLHESLHESCGRRARPGQAPGVSGSLCALIVCSICAVPDQALASYEEHLLVPAGMPAAPGPMRVVTAPEAGLFQEGLFQEGTGAAVPRVTSQGTKVPLAYALSLLTPRGWICHGAHQASRTPVSWNQDEDWLALLTRLGHETQSAFIVDWTQRTLTVRPAERPAAREPGQASAQKAAGATGTQAAATMSRPTGRDLSPAATQAEAPKAGSAAPARTSARAELTATTAPGPRIVSHDAGDGRVFLAYGMSVQEAARVLDTPLTRLMRWNHLEKEAFLPRGTALWLKDPASARTKAAASRATENRAAAAAKTPGQTMARKTDQKADQKADQKTGQKPGLTISAAVPASVRTAPSAKTGSSVPISQPGQAVPADPAGAGRQVWTIAPGLLKQQLEAWAAQAGYQVVWAPDTDMELEARASFTGPFPSAVRALFEGLYAQGSPFTARLYHGNRILKVEDR